MSRFSTQLASEFVVRCRATSIDESTKAFQGRVQAGQELATHCQEQSAASLRGCNPQILKVYDGVVHFMSGLNLDERLFILTKIEAAMIIDAVEHVKSVHAQAVEAHMERKRQAELQKHGLVPPSTQGFDAKRLLPVPPPPAPRRKSPLSELLDL